MTDKTEIIEIIERAICKMDVMAGTMSPPLTDEQRALVIHRALTAAGYRVFTKQEAIDYVLDLPIEDFNNTALPQRESVGKRLKSMTAGEVT